MKCSCYLFLLLAAASLVQLNGCATMVAVAESALTPPSISETVDSFESAALAIQTSNRLLLEAPISEEESWPEKLFQAPGAENSIRMALSGGAAYFGVTVPTAYDRETGFPRPTSPLYIMIKDRNQLLDRELNRAYLDYFRSNPDEIAFPIISKKHDNQNEFVYRNPLMAYGTVSGNNEELAKLEQKAVLMARGYRECDAWVRKSSSGSVIPAACRDTGLRGDEVEKALQINLTREELEIARKNYGKLSTKIYQASVAGADFTAAALTKIIAVIIKLPEALKNANNEFKGWKGAANTAMLMPRLKNLASSIGIYRDNLGTQFTAYSTMYNQTGEKYEIRDTGSTSKARDRIERFRIAYAELAPRLNQTRDDSTALFSAEEIAAWEQLAALFPYQDQMSAVFSTALVR